MINYKKYLISTIKLIEKECGTKIENIEFYECSRKLYFIKQSIRRNCKYKAYNNMQYIPVYKLSRGKLHQHNTADNNFVACSFAIDLIVNQKATIEYINKLDAKTLKKLIQEYIYKMYT